MGDALWQLALGRVASKDAQRWRSHSRHERACRSRRGSCPARPGQAGRTFRQDRWVCSPSVPGQPNMRGIS